MSDELYNIRDANEGESEIDVLLENILFAWQEGILIGTYGGQLIVSQVDVCKQELAALRASLSEAQQKNERVLHEVAEARRAIETSLDMLRNPAFSDEQRADLAYQRLWDWWDKHTAAAALADDAGRDA